MNPKTDTDVKMARAKSNEGQDNSWDNGEFGVEEEFVKVTEAIEAAEVDGALELKMISIRLQTDLIAKLKVIAKFHGIGYQSLIRSQLHRFVRSELAQMAAELGHSEIIKNPNKNAANG